MAEVFYKVVSCTVSLTQLVVQPFFPRDGRAVKMTSLKHTVHPQSQAYCLSMYLRAQKHVKQNRPLQAGDNWSDAIQVRISLTLSRLLSDPALGSRF